MHGFLASILTAAGLAAAATTTASSESVPDLSKVPPCALQCLTEAAGSSSCSVIDAYCQCTTGAADVIKVLAPCLCQSSCTPQDLMKTIAASAQICSTALKAHGEEFKAPAASPEMCKMFAGGAASPKESPPSNHTGPEPSVQSPQTNMTPASPPGHGANATNTSGTSGAQSSTGGAAGVEVGMRMVGTMALIGLVGAGVATL